MRTRHDQPPPIGTDALDIADDIATIVLAILERPRLIAQDQRPEEDLTQQVAREYQAELSLRPIQLGQLLQVPLCGDGTGERRIGDIVEHALRLGADLDHATAISAVGNRSTTKRRVRIEQNA